MTCREAQEQMWRRLSQANVEDIRLQQHLASCPGCARTWQEMRQFEQDLSNLKLQTPSARFVDNVMERVEQAPLHPYGRPARNRWTTWNHLWVASAATFALCSMVSRVEADSSSGLQAFTVYALKIGWAVTEMAGKISNVF